MSHNPQYKAAAKRAAGLFDCVGKPVRSVARETDTALIEMMVLDVREGLLRPAVFLQHPAHLPEGVDLKSLMTSAIAKDAQLRIDAYEWASVNRREAGRASVGLKNAVTAMRLAADLVDHEEDVDERVHGWGDEIAVYLQTAFGCDPHAAPHSAEEFSTWCSETCNKANPVPEWLQVHRSGGPVSTVDPKRERTTATRDMVDRYGGDDD